MPLFELTVPGQPGAKGRPRFVRATGRSYTPQRTVNAEGVIKQFAAEAMNGRPLLASALKLEVDLVFAVPPSWPRKKREAALAGGPHIVAPDADNALKLIFDSLNNVVWTDDRIVATVTVRKTYGSNPLTRIVIREFGELAPGFNFARIRAALTEMETEGKASVDAVFEKI
jgi:Holliday junction resolvase RusA-like endonuclease